VIAVPLLLPVALPLLVVAAVDVVAVPPDTRCPERSVVADALADRVPDEVAGWRAWYQVQAPEPAGPTRVRFELTDDRGRVRIRRELSVAGDGCAAAAQGLAIIVERFFQGVAWTAAVPLPEIERAPEPEAASFLGRAWELQAGLAARRDLDFEPALALDARVALARGWWAALGFIVPYGPVSQPVGTATLHLDSLPVRASARWRVARRALALEVGPALTVVAERATAAPALLNGAVYRVAVLAGAVACGQWWLSPRWALELEVAADVTVAAPPFTVDGFGQVLRPGVVPVMALLAVSHAFWR